MAGKERSSKRSLTDREFLFFQCALLTTAAVKQPFRARDVLFFIDLIKHVFHKSISEHFLKLQTVQVLRILDHYVADRCAIKLSAASRPSYRFLARGCAQLLADLAEPNYLLNVGDALFIQSYLNSYAEIIAKLFATLGPTVETDLVQKRLGRNELLRAQLRLLDEHIEELEHRIAESQKMTSFIAKHTSFGLGPEEIIPTLPSEYSYMASHQKPFKKFLEEMPAVIQKFEFEQGFVERREGFYRPYLTYLQDARRLFTAKLGERP